MGLLHCGLQSKETIQLFCLRRRILTLFGLYTFYLLIQKHNILVVKDIFSKMSHKFLNEGKDTGEKNQSQSYEVVLHFLTGKTVK